MKIMMKCKYDNNLKKNYYVFNALYLSFIIIN